MKFFTFSFPQKMTTPKQAFRAAGIGIGTAIFLLFGFVGCASFFSESIRQAEQESSGTAPIEDSSWVPEGFTQFNQKVATKWIEAPSDGCYVDGCYSMEVVSSETCNHLYVELSLLDGNGANVGFTNDATSSLSAGQKAILVFNATDGSSAKISKINCF